MSAEFRVDGNPLPPPSAVMITPQVLAESARALDGTLHVDYRATRRVILINWLVLDPAEMQVVESAIVPYRVVELQWTEPGGTTTISAVPRNSSRKLEVGRSRWDGTVQRWWWADVYIEFEEV